MQHIEIFDRLYKEVGKEHNELPLNEQLDVLKLYHETGDHIYANMIIKSNLKLIMGICKTFLRNTSPELPIYLDVHSEAFKEALDCLDRFKFDIGECTVPSWIRNNVFRCITSYVKSYKHVVKYTPIVHDKLDLHHKARNAFYTVNERFPVKGDEVNFLYKGRRVDYEFKNDLDNPKFISDTCKVSSGEDELFLFDIVKQEDENIFYFEDEEYKKSILKKIINLLPFRHKQLIDLIYYRGVKIKDVNTKITPLTQGEMIKAKKNKNNRLNFSINGEKKILDVYLADYDIIDVQKNDENYSFLLNEEYFTNKEKIMFFLSENIHIEYDGNIYKGEKNGNRYVYHINLKKKMNPALVRMSVDIELAEAINSLKKYILKNRILSSLR